MRSAVAVKDRVTQDPALLGDGASATSSVGHVLGDRPGHQAPKVAVAEAEERLTSAFLLGGLDSEERRLTGVCEMCKAGSCR